MKSLLTALCLAFLASSALAEDRVLSSEMCGTYFFVKVVLDRDDGRDEEARTLRMLYDTGASSNYVDPVALERASGIWVDPGERARIIDADTGPIHFNFIRARVRDLSHLSQSLGYPIDGILAHDTFEDFTIVLDYQAQTLTLTETPLPRHDGDRIFRTARGDDRPWINMRFNGRQRRILIDSGAGTTLSINHIDRYDTQTPPMPVGFATRINRLEPRLAARLDGDVTFGDFTFAQPMLTETPSTQLIGGALLSQFRISYDPSAERMMFEPYEEGAIASRPYRSLGVAMAPHENGLEVVSRLTEDAPDLQAGDIITHLDGQPVGQHGCRSPDDMSPRQITRVRDGESSTFLAPVLILIE